MIKQEVMLRQDDQELIANIVNKDKKSFSALYDKYAKAMYGVIFGITGNVMVSEEILQAAFCAVWRLAAEYEPTKQRLFTWMLRMAGKMATEQLVSQKHKIHGTNKYVNDPKDLINLERSKGVLDLIFTRGHTLQEAAEKEGCPADEIRGRLHLECNAIRDYK